MATLLRIASAALLAALALPGGPAGAQSLLSDARLMRWAAPEPASAALTDMTLDQLAALAERERAPAGLFAVLWARYGDELRRAKTDAERAALDRKAVPALLRLEDPSFPPGEQERLARGFADRYPDDDRFPQVFFALNAALSRQGKPLEESFFFDQGALAALSPGQRSRYFQMQAETAERQGEAIKAAEFRLKDWEEAGSDRDARRQKVLDALESAADPAAVDAMIARHGGTGWLQDARTLLLARAAVNSAPVSEAVQAYARIESGTGFFSGGRALAAARTELQARLRARAGRIGVLLPLTSTSASLRELAQDVLDGLRMAVQAPSGAPEPERGPRLDGEAAPVAEGVKTRPAPPPAPRVELVIRDTANNPRHAAQMVEALVKDDQVIAIIGPLARNESEAAALKAEEMGVPLVSLSLSMDLPPGGRFSFRNSKSQDDEVRDLVWYAHDYLEANRFAILYPDTAYGQRMMELFWDEVRRKGGEIVGAAPFAPLGARPESGRRSLGLKEVFDAFTGVNRMLSQDDLRLLAAVGDSRPDPVVDFDALYIPLGPDAAQDLRLIAPYPVTVDAERVQLLGNRFWNDDAVAVVGGAHLDGAVFLDVYDRSSGNPRMAEFQGRHRAMFAHRARYQSASYYTALGYDTIQMLLEQLRDPSARSRAALARALKTRPGFAGVTGLTSFRPSGEAVKESAFFRIRGGEVIRISH